MLEFGCSEQFAGSSREGVRKVLEGAGRCWKVLEGRDPSRFSAFQHLISREDFVLFTLHIHNYFWKDI